MSKQTCFYGIIIKKVSSVYNILYLYVNLKINAVFDDNKDPKL